MSRITIRTQRGYKFETRVHERGFTKGHTVPNDAMSIREILDRHARGLPLGGSRVPIYEPDSDLPDPRTLDLAERQELSIRYTEELAEIKEREKKLKIAKGDAEAAAKELKRKQLLDELKKSLAEDKPA